MATSPTDAIQVELVLEELANVTNYRVLPQITESVLFGMIAHLDTGSSD